MNIKYLKHEQIDFTKWDHCVNNSLCSLPYALSFYLDETCNHQWNALILDDYKAVMPLPIRKKYAVQYIYQPYFSQQLGIYSSIEISETISNLFLQSIPSEFKYIDLYLNYKQDIDAKKRCNLILDITSNYETIASKFSDNLKRNISKSNKQKFELVHEQDGTTFLAFAKNIMLDEAAKIYSTEIYALLEKLVKMLLNKELGQIYLVKKDTEIYSAVLLLKYRNRIINLVPLTSIKGKELNSSHFMYAQLIERFASTQNVFDFEGSEVKGVKNFYLQFGSEEQNYSHYKLNRLPKLLQFLKK